jgi:kumamolisin
VKQQLLSGEFPEISREEAIQAMKADPNDMAAVQSFLQQHGLTIVKENPDARTLQIAGTVRQVDEAFGTQLGWVGDAKGRQHLSYQGPLSVPQSLAGVIVAVLGLDQRPMARHA